MLQVNDISFSYTKNKPTLNNISLSLKAGEHLSVMGESGCGKSTLLKIIYGLLDVNEGSLFWNNHQILGPEYHLVPGMEFFKYVPQNFELMPFTTVAENISKHLSRFFPEEAKQRTQELLEVIEMERFAKVKVKTLSGGQQQRVAIARALAKEPELLLLDEPFSQIDNFKKNTLRRKLFQYLKNKNIACIVATHDGSDALSFSDQLIVIKDHSILAQGKPNELYQFPPNKYVAALFDDVNEIEVNGDKKLLYPHQIKVTDNSGIKAIVTKNYFKGNYWLIEALIDNQPIFLSHPNALTIGSEIYLTFKISE
ncbi:ABC-type Fe3+/spermidine/putrescine transport system ATPase subunit [Tenacibaculum skagerrakense]|uniref:ABC-type Fe3+/spermidine/putrescine transport system ATPase subunit n=1 Tax=Tenacibaculum skagerrakense TaxID=186571 RepID=A0A4R2P048_9FLAO|nr:ABC transporter ATP-binding protein [Tenacibaculum skagerrakense]TCP27993.1 ABC-type Fe3+/spermidine/putrescine transport system ATPase subunit [Tenacibaculum skagerrakense]